MHGDCSVHYTYVAILDLAALSVVPRKNPIILDAGKTTTKIRCLEVYARAKLLVDGSMTLRRSPKGLTPDKSDYGPSAVKAPNHVNGSSQKGTHFRRTCREIVVKRSNLKNPVQSPSYAMRSRSSALRSGTLRVGPHERRLNHQKPVFRPNRSGRRSNGRNGGILCQNRAFT
jgi:hypothetical protein